VNAREKMRLERALMDAMAREGLRGAERLVARMAREGQSFRLLQKGNGYRRWARALGEAREIEVSVWSHHGSRMASVQMKDTEPIRLTARQAHVDGLQRAFYARYMAIGEKAHAAKPQSLTPIERRLLLVGDLEAGVSNGGFSTYLSNKGRRIARSAMAALEAIGARRTARIVEKALAPGIGESGLGKLDDLFCSGPDDLARLAAEHAGLEPVKR
jgi:hypothetical protein